MATVPLKGVVERLRRRVLATESGTLSDGQLLELFVVGRDEAAFAALLGRHGPMVLSVCHRIVGNGHDAEEAFQATFLVLVHKAAALRTRDLVGPWLHGVARRTALKARTALARRRRVENAAARPDVVAEVESRQELRSLIDDAIQRLPEVYRLPVILCELEGRSRTEAARLLQVPEGTLSSRLAKARRLLAQRLAGTAFGLGVLSSPAVPATLVQSTLQAANRAVSGALLAPTVSWLEGIVQMMLLHKFATSAVLLFVAGLLGLSVGALPGGCSQPSAQAAAGDKEKKEQGPTVRGHIRAIDGKKSITLNVPKDGGKKESDQKTFRIAEDVKIHLADILDKKTALPEGTLADLKEGTSVDARLSPDGKAVVAITARGPSIHAGVKKFDKATGTLTLKTKDKDGATETTVTLLKEAKIILDDGLGKKGDAPKEGTTAHLVEGARVNVQLTVDRKRALGVRLEGGSIHGTLKGYDEGNRILTVEVKEDGGVVDKMLTLAKGAKVDGDLTAGSRVNVRLSIADKETAVGVHVVKE